MPFALMMIFSGCSDEFSNLPTNTISEYIINGIRDNNHKDVVHVQWKKPDETFAHGCTGTYLGSGLILTAAHCVPPDKSIRMAAHFEAPGIALLDGVLINDFTAMPDMLGQPQDTTNDIAALFMDNCYVPAGIKGIPVLNDAPLGSRDLLAQMTAVGFGSESRPTQMDPEGKSDGYRYSGTVVLVSLSTDVATVGPNYIFPPPVTLCHGDSGSPLLVSRGDTEYVAGVASVGDVMCNGNSDYTRVDSKQTATFIGVATVVALSALHSCGGAGGGGNHMGCGNGVSSASFGPIALAMAMVLTRRRRVSR